MLCPCYDWACITRLSESSCCLPHSPRVFCCQEKTIISFKESVKQKFLKTLVIECRKFCYKTGQTAKQTYDLLKGAFSDDTLCRSKMFQQYTCLEVIKNYGKTHLHSSHPSVSPADK
jgi:hypothetical protein